MAGKQRSKRKQDGELVTASWEGYRSQQKALEAHLGADGLKAAQQRAQALVEGGWAAVFAYQITGNNNPAGIKQHTKKNEMKDGYALPSSADWKSQSNIFRRIKRNN